MAAAAGPEAAAPGEPGDPERQASSPRPTEPATPALGSDEAPAAGRHAGARTPTQRETPGVPVERLGQRYSPTLKLQGAPEAALASHEHETTKAAAAIPERARSGGLPAASRLLGAAQAPDPAETLAGATFAPRPDPEGPEASPPPARPGAGSSPEDTLDGALFRDAATDPDATLDGARLRAGPAGPERRPVEAAGWLVEDAPLGGPPEGMWPIHRGPNLLGSDPQAVAGGIRVDHPDVSAVHLLLWHHDGRTWIIDLESRAGTWVAGHPLPALAGRELRDREHVRLGGLSLRFRALRGPDEG